MHEVTPKTISENCNVTYKKATNICTLWKEYKHGNLHEIYEQNQIIPILFTDSRYPKSLLHLYDPPAVLYAKGKIELLNNNKKIAIIGSRKATDYTAKSIEQILPPLIKEDYVIVSGLAKGADTMAHQITILQKGKTIAVLGSGFNHIYPKENGKLLEKMSSQQLVITEYPPYMSPKKWNFPKRNRIISGLSEGVVITEAEVKSGTVSTMEHALEHGKEIFAIPGPIFSPLSLGPNQLILEGARPIWDGQQILEELQNRKEKNR